MTSAEEVYRTKVREALIRLSACIRFVHAFQESNDVLQLESGALQARKALEAVAFASIAPNKEQYKNLRAQAETPADYRRDYNARKIFQLVGAINKDFYPVPLLEPTRGASGLSHLDRKKDGYLTKKEFEALYNRLGKFLHADNPWAENKGHSQLAIDLPVMMARLAKLLEFHFISIRVPNFNGAWVVSAAGPNQPITIVTSKAKGEYMVQPK